MYAGNKFDDEKEGKKRKEIVYDKEDKNNNENKKEMVRKDMEEKNSNEGENEKIRNNFLLLKWKELVRIGITEKKEHSWKDRKSVV